jgi:hypothetical protein
MIQFFIPGWGRRINPSAPTGDEKGYLRRSFPAINRRAILGMSLRDNNAGAIIQPFCTELSILGAFVQHGGAAQWPPSGTARPTYLINLFRSRGIVTSEFDQS